MCYIAYAKCGCAVALTVDIADKSTAADVAEFIRKGYRVERQSVSVLYDEQGKFRLGCKCPKQQLSLL